MNFVLILMILIFLMAEKCKKVFNFSALYEIVIKKNLSPNTVKNLKNYFKFELFIASDILFHKAQLSKCLFRKRQLHDESTLSKNTMEKYYSGVIVKIISSLENRFSYIIDDKTIDICRRYIANLLISFLFNKI